MEKPTGKKATKKYNKLTRKLYNTKWRKENPEKVKAQSKRRYARKREHILKVSVEWNRTVGKMRRYKISSDSYHYMLKVQNEMCGICDKKQSELVGRIKYLGIDHDHRTGKVRGLLCDRCNRGMGFFLDNTELLQRAINYLNKNDN